ncbi:hypothetical protein KKC08_05115 [Patescibacteria group bacterium]|nr:hypothetical protein [Patescibacteria group bacterium]MBU4264654.1 hypothetical protein [Patescibacteria group bacterium]MBU4390609.1 hypothetical protein [Patescibacteria group bacterium]MBU4397517.1 hypothetical protein [Patescibacteria group bacterium]MBU4431003.1 hypothetical protein [Patescibacteria group bacterium]
MSRRCDNLTETDIEIARESRIENLINENPRRMGGNLVFCCPFHDEKSPSFTVFQDNHFHCFGCGQHGDSIDFLMLRDKMPFPQAVKFLLGAK